MKMEYAFRNEKNDAFFFECAKRESHRPNDDNDNNDDGAEN